MKNRQINSKSQLPEISRFDPQALVVGLRPGNICHIQRESVTALTSICIECLFQKKIIHLN
jgi:DNA-directed RNA polymerase subunit H (RpoH/RPB5)